MQAQMPWFETAEEATQNAIQHSAKNPKEVAHYLWPGLKMDSAYARLMGAMNPDRPEKLSADEHIAIAEFTGRADFLYYVAVTLRHTQPEPQKPADEAMDLDRQIVEGLRTMNLLLARRERVNLRGVGS